MKKSVSYLFVLIFILSSCAQLDFEEDTLINKVEQPDKNQTIVLSLKM